MVSRMSTPLWGCFGHYRSQTGSGHPPIATLGARRHGADSKRLRTRSSTSTNHEASSFIDGSRVLAKTRFRCPGWSLSFAAVDASRV